MKELRGSAAQTTEGSLEACYALLAAVEDYPTWYPDVVREVEVIERDASRRPVLARTTLHVARGPLVRDFHLMLAVELDEPRAVNLIRQRNDPNDQEEFKVGWRLTPGASGTRISLELDALLSVPRLLPLGGIGEAMAEGFVTAAARAVSHR